MFKYIKYSAFSMGLALLLSGCAASMTSEVNKPLTEITNDKSKSYIVFSRNQFIGAALSNTIVEFNPKTNELELVGILGANNRVVYETTKGEHFFYMTGGENDDMIKINTDENMMYYVKTQVIMGVFAGRFYFVPLKSPTAKLLKSFVGKKCNDEILDKYNFTVEENNDIIKSKKTYDSNQLNATIECKSGLINKASSYASTVDDLNSVPLVAPNEKAYLHYKKSIPDYLSEINEDFDEWYNEDMKDTELLSTDGFKL